MKDKINLLFFPFVETLLGLVAGYTLLNWMLFIEFEVFQLKEIITDVGIPIVLAGLAAWFGFRSRLKILNLEREKGNLRDLYSFTIWIILAAPLLIAQAYLDTASGQLTELYSINEINAHSTSRYYLLQNYYIDKSAPGTYHEFEVSGRSNDNLDMYIYVALPVFEVASDTIDKDPLAWLGIQYRKTISNRLDPDKKERSYQAFVRESQNDFDKKNFAEFVYLDRLRYSDKKTGYIHAIRENLIYDPGEVVFEAVNEPFAARNGNKLEWLLGSVLIGSVIWLIMLWIQGIDEQHLGRMKEGKPDKEAQEEMRDFINFLKPKEGYFVTPILIYANIGVYLFMVVAGLGFISFKGQDLLQWGANYGPLVGEGAWWRLFTSMFLHGGLMHLLANMYGLFFVGIFLEPLLGKFRYLTVYVLTGILGSISSIWWYEATVSVGASGAIFGLYGIFLTLLLTKLFPPDFTKSFLISTAIFVGFSLLMGLAGGIDNAAHIGGLVSGLVLGLVLYPGLKERIEDESKQTESLIHDHTTEL